MAKTSKVTLTSLLYDISLADWWALRNQIYGKFSDMMSTFEATLSGPLPPLSPLLGKGASDPVARFVRYHKIG